MISLKKWTPRMFFVAAILLVIMFTVKECRDQKAEEKKKAIEKIEEGEL